MQVLMIGDISRRVLNIVAPEDESLLGGALLNPRSRNVSADRSGTGNVNTFGNFYAHAWETYWRL